MILTPVFICMGGLLVSLVGEGTQRIVLRASGKAAASFAFLAFALLLGVADEAPHGQAVIAALVLSIVGDLALLSTERRWFLFGLVAFLLAHVAYVVAFIQLGTEPMGVGAAGVVLLPAAFIVWNWLAPHVGRMAKPVVAYITVITVMVALAAGCAAVDTARVPMLVAAVLFFTSDLFVARQRFITSTPVNRYVGLPLYYAAQLLFAWAAVQV